MGPWSKEKKEAFERLVLRRKDACKYCDNKATYNQPDKDTGEIVSVCKNHFNMNAAS